MRLLRLHEERRVWVGWEVRVPVDDAPLALFAAIDVGDTQCVRTRMPVDNDLIVLVGGPVRRGGRTRQASAVLSREVSLPLSSPVTGAGVSRT